MGLTDASSWLHRGESERRLQDLRLAGKVSSPPGKGEWGEDSWGLGASADAPHPPSLVSPSDLTSLFCHSDKSSPSPSFFRIPSRCSTRTRGRDQFLGKEKGPGLGQHHRAPGHNQGPASTQEEPLRVQTSLWPESFWNPGSQAASGTRHQAPTPGHRNGP